MSGKAVDQSQNLAKTVGSSTVKCLHGNSKFVF